jgi:hypothetical protein
MKTLATVLSVLAGILCAYVAFAPSAHAHTTRSAVSIERTTVAPTQDLSAVGTVVAGSGIVNVPEITITASAPRAARSHVGPVAMFNCRVTDSDSTFGGHITRCN